LHELSIAMEILDIVEKEASSHGASRVSRIFLRIGDLSGVETGSLTFSFDAIKGEKELTANAEMVIEKVPVKAHCKGCDREFTGEGHILKCPHCDGFQTKLLEGDEMKIDEIEVD
jgi:hydrogenase nickel incorporation protein HypA/HybF